MIPPSSRKSIGTRERRAVRFRPAVEGRVTWASIVPRTCPLTSLRSGQWGTHNSRPNHKQNTYVCGHVEEAGGQQGFFRARHLPPHPARNRKNDERNRQPGRRKKRRKDDEMKAGEERVLDDGVLSRISQPAAPVGFLQPGIDERGIGDEERPDARRESPAGERVCQLG